MAKLQTHRKQGAKMLLKIHEFETHSPTTKLILLTPKCKLILLNILRLLNVRRMSLETHSPPNANS